MAVSLGGPGTHRESGCSRRKLRHVHGDTPAPHETLDRQAAGGARASGRRPSGCRRACAAFSARRAPGHRRRVHAAARRKTVAAYYRRRRGRQPSARPRLSRAAPHRSASEAKAHGRRVRALPWAWAEGRINGGARAPAHARRRRCRADRYGDPVPATRRKGPVWVKERDRGVTLWGRARPMMEGERAPLRDHAKRVGNRRKPASECRDGHLTRKSKSKSKVGGVI